MTSKFENGVDIKGLLKSNDGVPCGTYAATKASAAKTLAQITKFQERIRGHIEDNYVNFMPNHTSSDLYLEEGEHLLKEVENLLLSTDEQANEELNNANAELAELVDKVREAALAMRVSERILKIDDLFQYVEEASGAKEYAVVLESLGKLKDLIYNESRKSDVDRVLEKCECYNTIKVKYHIQISLLLQNLQQRFEQLVQITEKPFSTTRSVTIQISKDENQVQDIVIALFQARYNPAKLCDFLLENCFEPLIKKPVSVEYSDDHPEYVCLKLSYSLKDLGNSLRPSYQQVFENIKLLLQCLSVINVSVSVDRHVFTIIGDHIRERLLKVLVSDCLMHAIPETMDELAESSIVDDVLQFEHMLADTFLINADTNRDLSEFADQFPTFFRNRFFRQVLESANEIMLKDMQDMTPVADEDKTDDGILKPFEFPQCMISRSTSELIKLLERILRQPKPDPEDDDADSFVNAISVILTSYTLQMPSYHEKLLESIPQQSALFYNNCHYLANWVAKNSEMGIPTAPALVKTLQSCGLKYLNMQIGYQQKIIADILKGLDFSDPHSLGTAPHKLLRQSLRQLELLKNVWQNVLPHAIYDQTFCEFFNDLCRELIQRILAMEDISATVANELSELIDLVLDKAPTLFKEKHEVVRIPLWMKLQQLKLILNGSLIEITELWCGGAGILTANYKAEEVRHLIRALFQNTDRRATALKKIV